MKIFICDNNELLCEHIKKMIYEIYNEKQVEVYIFNYANEMFDEINRVVPDFVLLDISLGNDYGINIAKKLNKISKSIKIIYITSHLEFVQDICETNYLNILIKPIQKEKLKKVLSIDAEELLVIKTATSICNIRQSEIRYIESRKRQAFIHTENECISCYLKLTEIMPKLCASFYLCHKSFIVNMDKIYRFSNSMIVLSDGTEITVSRSNLKSFQQTYTDYLGDKL